MENMFTVKLNILDRNDVKARLAKVEVQISSLLKSSNDKKLWPTEYNLKSLKALLVYWFLMLESSIFFCFLILEKSAYFCHLEQVYCTLCLVWLPIHRLKR